MSDQSLTRKQFGGSRVHRLGDEPKQVSPHTDDDDGGVIIATQLTPAQRLRRRAYGLDGTPTPDLTIHDSEVHHGE